MTPYSLCVLFSAVLFLSSCAATPVEVPLTSATAAEPTLTRAEQTAIPTSTLPPTTTSVTTETPPSTIVPAKPDALTADVIFFGGQVVTMEADQPTAQAVAILGDKIIAVGSDSEILDLQSPQTTLVNLERLTLLPGFVDAHSHLFNTADQWGLDWEGAQQLALAYGITSVANTYADPAFLSEMQAFSESGRLRIRTSLYLNYNTNCGDVVGTWYRDHLPSHAPAERLRIGGVKIFADGGSCGAPAMSFDHPAFGYGDLWFTQDELNQVLSDVQASGHQAAVHALGDRAVEQTLNALEFVLDGRANTFRHRIEHNALVRDDLLPRYGEVGVVPLLFGSYPVCAPDAVPPPEEQDGWEWRWSELIDQNPDLHFAWHSDMHTFLFAQISPLQHLFSLVTPFEVASDGATICDTPAWIGAKTLPVEQALPMMTIEGAYALFQDEAVGSIRPGKLADLLIISGNPLNEEPVEIIDLRILMTMIGGRVEHCEDGYEDLCSFQP